jgi:hypothetical protein
VLQARGVRSIHSVRSEQMVRHNNARMAEEQRHSSVANAQQRQSQQENFVTAARARVRTFRREVRQADAWLPPSLWPRTRHVSFDARRPQADHTLIPQTETTN